MSIVISDVTLRAIQRLIEGNTSPDAELIRRELSSSTPVVKTLVLCADCHQPGDRPMDDSDPATRGYWPSQCESCFQFNLCRVVFR